MNMAVSADGKISTRKRERMMFGSRNDRDMMDRLRSRVDAIIIGAGTLTVDGFPLIVRNKEIREMRVKKGLPPHPVNIILSRTLKMPIRRPIFSNKELNRIIYTTRTAQREQRKRFEKRSQVIVLPSRNYLRGVMSNLSASGMKNVLVEGGGELNYAFFKEAFVDELYLTVTPRIIGGGNAPTLVDGIGFLKENHVALELISSKRVDQEVYLRYRVR
jgi:2,5-diamino-6-(ribosylamino)-4(3H)-pyrimidinone 5'-phosphate reductase